MNTYQATAKAMYSDQKRLTECPITFHADNMESARDWIVNHLDTSYEWTVERTDGALIDRFKVTP